MRTMQKVEEGKAAIRLALNEECVRFVRRGVAKTSRILTTLSLVFAGFYGRTIPRFGGFCFL